MEKIDLKKLKSLIKKIKENPNLSVVAKRVKRSEGPIFSIFISIT